MKFFLFHHQKQDQVQIKFNILKIYKKYFNFIFFQFQQLIKKIRKSNILREKLEKALILENIEPLQPIIGIKVRWNSTFDSIERGLKIKVGLNAIASSTPKLRNYQLDEDEWKQLADLHKLLQVKKIKKQKSKKNDF